MRRIAPEAKLLGAVALAAAVVAVPARAWPVLLGVAFLVVVLLAGAGVGSRWVWARAVVVLPFLAVALVLPLVATGERVTLGPLAVSRPGLGAAALLLARCLVAWGVALVLVGTTGGADLADGLARLRVPAPLVLVLGLMLRYLGVVRDDLRRMAVARASRGGGRDAAALRAAAAVGVGRLFVRSYERGERVHLAMVSRGYDGTPPAAGGARTPAWHWPVCLAPALATALAVVGWPG